MIGSDVDVADDCMMTRPPQASEYEGGAGEECGREREVEERLSVDSEEEEEGGVRLGLEVGFEGGPPRGVRAVAERVNDMRMG
jgi:hypothetical protein